MAWIWPTASWYALVHLANWSPRLGQSGSLNTIEFKHKTYLNTNVPSIGTASIHFPSVFLTCKAPTLSCQRIVKHWEETWAMHWEMQTWLYYLIARGRWARLSQCLLKYLLGMCPYSQYPIVDLTGRLWRIMQQTHNRSRFRCFIIEEVLRKIKGKGKKREQRLPKADKMMTRMTTLVGDCSRGGAAH